MTRFPLTIALATTLLASAPAALAQAVQSDTPQFPKVPGAIRLRPPAPARHAPVNADKVVIDELKGIRLVPDAASLQPADRLDPGLASTVPLARAALGRLQPWLGKPVTLRRLTAIENRLIGWYRAHGHPFVSVTTPPQDITGGVIQIIVMEYHVGQVRVLKARWSHPAAIRSAIHVAPGGTIDAGAVDQDLTWLNRNPFRTIDVVATPGKVPGTTDLDFVVHDRFAASVYAGYANDGNLATGIGRYKAGVLWGNAFGTNQQLGYQYTASTDLFAGGSVRPGLGRAPAFQAHAATLDIALPWHADLQLLGLYEQDRPNLGPDFTSIGHSGQVSARYVMALKPAARLSQQIALGFDFKTTDNNLDFGGTAVSRQASDIDQFSFGYSAARQDASGETRLDATLVISPGGITPRNTTADFEPGANRSGVFRADAAYVYDRITIARDTRLQHGLVWSLRVSGQVASTNLLPSEQMLLGGMDSLRGYRALVAGGTDGVNLSNDLRAPALHPLRTAGIDDALQFDAFFDWGHVWQVHRAPTDPAPIDLASFGVGARYTAGRHLDARVELGVPLERLQPGATLHAFAGVTVTVRP